MGARHSQSSEDQDRPKPPMISKTVSLFEGCDRRYDVLLKIVMNGRAETGKSCLCERFSGQGWTQSRYVPTVGVDFVVKTIELDDIRIKVQVWDLSGEERFRGIQSSFYRGAVGVILVFSVTDRKSFNDISMWYQKVNDYATSDSRRCFILVGNKCDLEDQRQVSYLEAKDVAAKKGMQYIEVSAKDGTNVELILPTLVTLIGEVWMS